MEFFLLVFQSYKKVVAEEVDSYCKKYITKEDSKPSLAELCEVKMRNGNTEATDKVKSIIAGFITSWESLTYERNSQQ